MMGWRIPLDNPILYRVLYKITFVDGNCQSHCHTELQWQSQGVKKVYAPPPPPPAGGEIFFESKAIEIKKFRNNIKKI